MEMAPIEVVQAELARVRAEAGRRRSETEAEDNKRDKIKADIAKAFVNASVRRPRTTRRRTRSDRLP